jgi:solute carrier family 45 protein 1/2/4
VGSTALIVHSTVGFATSIVLPWLVTSPGDEVTEKGFTPRPPQMLKPVIELLSLSKPKLLNVWTAGNVSFGVAMLFAPLVKSVGFATFLMAFVGVPSAIAGLAVGTYIGIEVNRLGNTLPSSTAFNDKEKEKPLPLLSSPSGRSSPSIPSSPSSSGELSGIYLGILNIYTTLPQFVGTGISWVVFSILEPGKSPELAKDAHPDEHHSTEGLSGIGVCLFIGELCALMAAKVSRGLKEG